MDYGEVSSKKWNFQLQLFILIYIRGCLKLMVRIDVKSIDKLQWMHENNKFCTVKYDICYFQEPKFKYVVTGQHWSRNVKYYFYSTSVKGSLSKSWLCNVNKI